MGLSVFIGGMRTESMKMRLRRLGAVFLVVAYGLGALLPTVAFASADRSSIIHALSESHGGRLNLHVHTAHEGHHGSPAKYKQEFAHHCCGVVSPPGLEVTAIGFFLQPKIWSALSPSVQIVLSGNRLSRLDRPPKSLTA